MSYYPQKIRRYKRWLLGVAWLLLLGSLPAPALNDHGDAAFFLFFLDVNHTPVIVVVIASAIALARMPASPFSVVLVGLALFLFAPMLLNRSDRPPRVWPRIVALGLLAPWAFPLLCRLLPSRDPGGWGCGRIMWGYYLFATAHTLAFVAVQIGPRRPKHDRRRGFPVIEPEEQARPPEDSRRSPDSPG